MNTGVLPRASISVLARTSVTRSASVTASLPLLRHAKDAYGCCSWFVHAASSSSASFSFVTIIRPLLAPRQLRPISRRSACVRSACANDPVMTLAITSGRPTASSKSSGECPKPVMP